MLVPPGFDFTYDTLPDEALERHEALVGVFGQHVMWLLNTALFRANELLASADSRQRLAGLFRRPYEHMAEQTAEVRSAALDLVAATNRGVVQRFLWILMGQGFDNTFGPDHVIRFRLVMEICDAETGEVIEEDVINRGGKRSFSEYWGRWLNRYGKVGLTDPPPDDPSESTGSPEEQQPPV